MVNEFRISQLCNCCNKILDTDFLERPSQKPKLKKENKLCHGLLRCRSKYSIIEIRILCKICKYIIKPVFETGNRPDIFCRGVNS